MAVQKVLRMGDPRLLQPSEAVEEFNTPALKRLIADLFDTMTDYQGAGLAAPQIGVMQRVVIFGFASNSRYPQEPGIPETVLINPLIEPLTGVTEDGWEGCLSVPGMRALVPRFKSIRYRGFDAQGRAFSREVDGFHARVVQHECDHLDGILYPQRIRDMRSFGFREELEQAGRLTPQPCDD